MLISDDYFLSIFIPIKGEKKVIHVGSMKEWLPSALQIQTAAASVCSIHTTKCFTIAVLIYMYKYFQVWFSMHLTDWKL